MHLYCPCLCCCLFFDSIKFVCLYLLCHQKYSYQNGRARILFFSLTLPHFFVCTKLGPRFLSNSVLFFLVLWEVCLDVENTWNSFIHDLYIFLFIFTHDNIYYQATSIVQTCYRWFQCVTIGCYTNKSSINILLLIWFNRNDFRYDIYCPEKFILAKQIIYLSFKSKFL